MPLSTTLHFVRHGNVENPQSIYYGRLPGFRLSREGESQSVAAATWLSQFPIAVVYTSPMLRARQTAKVIIDAFVFPPPILEDDRLNEVYSPFDGVPHREMERRDWDFYTGTPRQYEQPHDLHARTWAFINEVCQRHPGGHVVGVTHGDTLAFLWMWVLIGRLDIVHLKQLDAIGLTDDYPATASISSFTVEDGRVMKHSYLRPY